MCRALKEKTNNDTGENGEIYVDGKVGMKLNLHMHNGK